MTIAATSTERMMRPLTDPVVAWLLGVAGLVFCMIVVGGITRLTGSGLSMVEWRPLMGILPPLSDGEWQRVFTLYKQSPEYIHVNSGMGIDEFKTIFFWEYVHRVLGRVIGLAYGPVSYTHLTLPTRS